MSLLRPVLFHYKVPWKDHQPLERSSICRRQRIPGSGCRQTKKVRVHFVWNRSGSTLSRPERGPTIRSSHCAKTGRQGGVHLARARDGPARSHLRVMAPTDAAQYRPPAILGNARRQVLPIPTELQQQSRAIANSLRAARVWWQQSPETRSTVAYPRWTEDVSSGPFANMRPTTGAHVRVWHPTGVVP